MTPGSAKRILIAPLDWGLGHTTRCIPIIRRLLEQKHEVLFAGNDSQQTFVLGHFPDLRQLSLAGYDVRYGKRTALPALLRQLPRLVRRVRDEHQWLLDVVAHERIDAVISDNRYGLWHPEIPSVILTHQPGIRSGFGTVADALVRILHYQMLRRFSQCWIVDVQGEPSLGGSLSHPAQLPPHARYIGWISQFYERQATKPEGYLLVLLSGPEPLRGSLSEQLWPQACSLNMPVVFVEGSANARRNDIPGHIRHYTRISGDALQSLLEGAGTVVCRSGYSSLMDLLLLRKKAILIPTPGQPEQEYLGRRLHEAGVFYHAPQAGFSLEKALRKAAEFPYRLPEQVGAHERYLGVLDKWLLSF